MVGAVSRGADPRLPLALAGLAAGCQPDVPLRAPPCPAVKDECLVPTYGATVPVDTADTEEDPVLMIDSHPFGYGAITLPGAQLSDPLAYPEMEPLRPIRLGLRFTVLPDTPDPPEALRLPNLPSVRGLSLAFITGDEGARALGDAGASLGLQRATEAAPVGVVEGFALVLDLVRDLEHEPGIEVPIPLEVEPPYAHAALVQDGELTAPLLVGGVDNFVLANLVGEVELQINDDASFELSYAAAPGVPRALLLEGEIPIPLGTPGRWAVIGVAADAREVLKLDQFTRCDGGEDGAP